MNAKLIEQLGRIKAAGREADFVAYLRGWMKQTDRTATGKDLRHAVEAFMEHLKPAEGQ